MADDASNLKLRVDAVPGDLSGLDEAEAKLGKVAEASGEVGAEAGEGEKGIARMVKEAGTIREAQRISQGFFDIFLGGGRSIQGAAEIMRFFIATAADINPIFATLAVVGASIAVVAGRQVEHNEKMEEGKTKSDLLTTSLDEQATAAKNVADAQTELIAAAGVQRTEESTALSELTTREATRTEELKKQLALLQQITQQSFEQSRAAALAQNKNGAEGAEQIKEYYDTLEAASQAQTDKERLAIEARGHLRQKRLVEMNLAKEQENQAEVTSRLGRVYGARKAQSDAAHLGIDAGSKGDYSGAIEELGKKLEGARKAEEDDQAEKNDFLNTLLLSKDEREEEYRVALSDDRIAIRSLTTAIEVAKRAQASASVSTTTGPALEKQLDESGKRVVDLQLQLEKLKSGLQDDLLQQQAAAKTAQTKKAADSLTAARDQQALADRNFAAKNKADLTKAEADAANENLPLSERKTALRSATTLKNAALQRQRDEDQSIGTVPGYAPEKYLSQEERAGLSAQIETNLKDLTTELQKLTSKASGVSAANKPEYDAAASVLEGLVKEGEARIRAGGNATALQDFNDQPGLQGRAEYLRSRYQGASDGGARDMADQIAHVMTEMRGLAPAKSNLGADSDFSQLQTKVNEGHQLAQKDHLERILATIDATHDLQMQANIMVDKFAGASDVRLGTIAQQIKEILARLAAQANHG